MNHTRLGLIGLLFFVFCFPSESAFAVKGDFTVLSGEFDQHFNPGETTSFTVIVENNTDAAAFVEVDITLVSTTTGVETTLVPVLTGTAPANGTITFRENYVISDQAGTGLFTVSFPAFDGNGDRIARLGGRFPIHIGTETETIKVFPEVMNLGTLPPGRYMHPIPMEIRYDHFRFNRLRLDQPWYIRMYTDNEARFHGIPDAIHRISPAGLVSLDGRYSIPIKIWNLNFGPDLQDTGWDTSLAGPPPVEDDDFWIGPPLLEGVNTRSYGAASWVRIPDLRDMTADSGSWRRIIGQDPTQSTFAVDSNITGDIRLDSPFTVYFATDAQAAAVENSYSADLIVELWTP